MKPRRPVVHTIPGRLTGEEMDARDKHKELQRCIRSSWYLATEYLGYEYNEQLGIGLVDRVHEPICKWYDRNQDEPRIGIWMARGRHKTTLVVTWIIRDILADPTNSHRYWHAVNDLAAEFLLEVVSHFRNNERLRWLDPVGYDSTTDKRYNIFPTKQATRWYKTAKGDATLRVGTNRRFGAGTRSATLRAQGQSSEVTGAHISGVGWMDDIIAESTVLNSELHKVAEWYRRSVVPVVDSKKFRVVGTPWPGQTIYKQWMKSGRWRTLIVPGAIEETDEEFKARLQSDDKKIHFVPDYKLTNPMHGTAARIEESREKLRDEQEDMQGAFGPQIMMDDEPASARPWVEGAEQFCGLRERSGMPGAMEGEGFFVVLSDPAPHYAGSYKAIGEKARADGTKDWWSVIVYRVRLRKQLTEYIIMDGIHSLEWGEEDGCDHICGLMGKWRSNLFFSEDADVWHDRMRRAARRNGVPLRTADDGGPMKYKIYNKAGAGGTRKHSGFTAFSDMNRNGILYICDETCPREFLYGDGERTGLLTQARKWQDVGGGKTNLRFDDDADVASRITDPAIQSIAPQPTGPMDSDSFEDEDDAYQYRSRYCAV